MAERSQVDRIKAKVSGEPGRNRMSVSENNKTNQQRSGQTPGPDKKPKRDSNTPTQPATNQQRNSKGSAYGALPSSKGNANMKGMD
jgi:hypothetical protein